MNRVCRLPPPLGAGGPAPVSAVQRPFHNKSPRARVWSSNHPPKILPMAFDLQNSPLLVSELYLAGTFRPATSGKTFPVLNPANGEEVARCADAGAKEVEKAVEAARSAFPRWSSLTAGERADHLKAWHRLILEHAEDLARLLTTEQGKPIREARGEVAYGASFVDWFAAEALRNYGDVIPGHAPGKRITVLRQPVGVVAAITPWNFPVAMVTRKVAPALAAGCPVILKPAEDTPLCALALAKLADEAGLPPGVFQVLPTSDPASVGDPLLASPVVRKLSFTGSTAVGKKLMAAAAPTLKKLSLELGGNAPFIVFPDADLDAAVQGAIASKFRNAGQTCVCANRFYVHEDVYDQFVWEFANAANRLYTGFGDDEDVDVGPLINQAAQDKVTALVDDAVAKGARTECGGYPDDDDLFYFPTVLSNVSTHMRVAHEEIFGPVAPVFKFSTEEEVITQANATPAGLAAYFYGRDQARCWRVAEALEYGMVGINTGMISTAVAPFGGVKESGFGREGSKYGLEEYTVLKYLCWSE